MGSLASASSVAKQKEKLTGQTRRAIIRERYQTGLNYVADAIFTMMDLIKHSDGILENKPKRTIIKL